MTPFTRRIWLMKCTWVPKRKRQRWHEWELFPPCLIKIFGLGYMPTHYRYNFNASAILTCKLSNLSPRWVTPWIVEPKLHVSTWWPHTKPKRQQHGRSSLSPLPNFAALMGSRLKGARPLRDPPQTFCPSLASFLLGHCTNHQEHNKILCVLPTLDLMGWLWTMTTNYHFFFYTNE